jgi:hypothetical protein
MDGVVEIIPGRERRRCWSLQDKVRIVAETNKRHRWRLPDDAGVGRAKPIAFETASVQRSASPRGHRP